MVNEHPVWKKPEITGLYDAWYIWLTITNNDWLWVIGTNYNSSASILAECRSSTNIASPSLCGPNWYAVVNDALLTNVMSHGGTCDLGDNYVCTISSGVTTFASGGKYNGRYRQIHPYTPLWIGETTTENVMIQIANFNQVGVPAIGYSYVITDITLNENVAACFISVAEPANIDSLSPQYCYGWYVKQSDGTWIEDVQFDIDSCYHPSNTPISTGITYPENLCFNDPTNTASHYQSMSKWNYINSGIRKFPDFCLQINMFSLILFSIFPIFGYFIPTIQTGTNTIQIMLSHVHSH